MPNSPYQTGRRLVEKRLPCELDRIVQWLEPYRARLKRMAVESTYNWYWLVDGLQQADFAAIRPGRESRTGWTRSLRRRTTNLWELNEHGTARTVFWSRPTAGWAAVGQPSCPAGALAEWSG